jgi:hypothetical protein
MTAGAARDLALGVVGNCAFNALIDSHGRIVWCCLPRPQTCSLVGTTNGATRLPRRWDTVL